MTEELLWLSVILLLVGVFLIKIPTEVSRRKATRKLGYGPIPWSTWNIEGFSWPREYKSSIFSMPKKLNSLGFEYKPEYKSKIAKWNTEFEKEIYRYRPLRVLAILFIIAGFFAFIYYLSLTIGF